MRLSLMKCSICLNRYCTTKSSFRVHDLGEVFCVLNEVPSPYASDRNSVMLTMSTVISRIEEPNTQPLQPATDASTMSQLSISRTTETRQTRPFYEIINFKSDLTIYRQALHKTFMKSYLNLRQITPQRSAVPRGTIINNNIIPEVKLQYIKEEI